MTGSNPASEAPELSVVVPVWNEERNLEPLIAEIEAALDGRLTYEMLYVDDGSTDDSHARLLELRVGRRDRLRVLRHARRSGQSAALCSGVRAARATWIATLDGDGQNDPGDILRLFELARDPAADPLLRMIAGQRRQRRDRWIKRVSSRVANAVRRLLLRGLKVFHRETFLGLPCFDHMHRFLPALILREGLQVRSVEVHHRPRAAGRSKYGTFDRLWVGVIDICGVLWLRRRIARADTTEAD